MLTFNVYVLSEIDCNKMCDINKLYPRGPQLIVCDHGSGPCVNVNDIEDPIYVEWRNALDLIVPFSSRTPQEVTIDNL